VAWNNLRLGRSDRRGATKLATFIFGIMMCAWALGVAHVRGLGELGLVIMALSFAAFTAGMTWLLYVAIEPYVRRHWPDALISWTRLQAGRVRDPLVASHVLAGIMANTAFGVGATGFGLAALRFLPAPQPSLPSHLRQLDSAAGLVSDWLGSMATNLFVVLAFVLVLVLFRLLIRRMWIADVAAAILFGGFGLVPNGGLLENVVGGLIFALAFYVEVWVLRRFGLLANATLVVVVYSLLPQMPVTFGSWYAGRELAGLGIMAAIAAWALWVIVSAQRRPGMDTSA
jgi:hypothetical protein